LTGAALLWGATNYYAPNLELDDKASDKFEEVFSGNPLSAKAMGLFSSEPNLEDLDVYAGSENVEFLGNEAHSKPISRSTYANQWYAVMGRYEAYMNVSENRAFMNDWYSQLDHLKNKSLEEQAAGVDGLVDELVTYEFDEDTYNQGDYWGTPVETAYLRQGDCDDFAILKYFSLRYLDVPAERMYLIGVATDNGNTLNHMTLMIDVEDRGVSDFLRGLVGVKPQVNWTILDNDGSPQGRLIEEDRTNFTPFFALNETGFWSISDQSTVWKPKPRTTNPNLS